MPYFQQQHCEIIQQGAGIKAIWVESFTKSTSHFRCLSKFHLLPPVSRQQAFQVRQALSKSVLIFCVYSGGNKYSTR